MQQSKNSTDTNLPEENEFVLIMLSSNEKNKVKPQYLWTKEYGDQVYENMRANISCSETNEKHHGLNGKYFGFGLISKYALQKNLSINTFAGNNAHNSEIRSTLREKLHVLMNNQQNVLPLSLFCGFLLTNSMLEICNKHHHDCADILRILRENEIDRNCVSCSNWIFWNAATRHFHQEMD